VRQQAEDLLDSKDTSGGTRMYILDPTDLDIQKDIFGGICTYVPDPTDLEQVRTWWYIT
jgi:hypothetical protein